ncbi:hypothetical protein FA95DRAFT_1605485 [Auriscalpium vulgare]|uniref:Uncharacterized protein n=1 Tax=Auriscalpium vulgare TaxID=40419 RepID=A0ACB8RXA2_9AGAM|nr:hypothetical protein FA95DRAFT_1605485 [Auriscalpium vulgare]
MAKTLKSEPSTTVRAGGGNDVLPLPHSKRSTRSSTKQLILEEHFKTHARASVAKPPSATKNTSAPPSRAASPEPPSLGSRLMNAMRRSLGHTSSPLYTVEQEESPAKTGKSSQLSPSPKSFGASEGNADPVYTSNAPSDAMQGISSTPARPANFKAHGWVSPDQTSSPLQRGATGITSPIPMPNLGVHNIQDASQPLLKTRSSKYSLPLDLGSDPFREGESLLHEVESNAADDDSPIAARYRSPNHFTPAPTNNKGKGKAKAIPARSPPHYASPPPVFSSKHIQQHLQNLVPAVGVAGPSSFAQRKRPREETSLDDEAVDGDGEQSPPQAKRSRVDGAAVSPPVANAPREAAPESPKSPAAPVSAAHGNRPLSPLPVAPVLPGARPPMTFDERCRRVCRNVRKYDALRQDEDECDMSEDEGVEPSFGGWNNLRDRKRGWFEWWQARRNAMLQRKEEKSRRDAVRKTKERKATGEYVHPTEWTDYVPINDAEYNDLVEQMRKRRSMRELARQMRRGQRAVVSANLDPTFEIDEVDAAYESEDITEPDTEVSDPEWGFDEWEGPNYSRRESYAPRLQAGLHAKSEFWQLY